MPSTFHLLTNTQINTKTGAEGIISLLLAQFKKSAKWESLINLTDLKHLI
jgi:hypothetical protein